MKKILVLCGIVILAVACQKQDMGGCKKEENSKNENVNVDLNAGESFVYEIPSSDGAASITTNAKPASLSRVNVVPATGASNYEYVSADNFSGSDEVSITVDPTKSTQSNCTPNNSSGCGSSQQQSCGSNNNNNNCGSSSKNTKAKVITFHFSVKCQNK